MSAPTNLTREPEFGINGLAQNEYYWLRHSDGTRFIAKLEHDHWWMVGVQWSINVTRDQVICQVKAPEN